MGNSWACNQGTIAYEGFRPYIKDFYAFCISGMYKIKMECLWKCFFIRPICSKNHSYILLELHALARFSL